MTQNTDVTPNADQPAATSPTLAFFLRAAGAAPSAPITAASLENFSLITSWPYGSWGSYPQRPRAIVSQPVYDGVE